MSYKFSFILLIFVCKFTHSLKISQCCENSLRVCEGKFSECTDFGCSSSEYHRAEGKSTLLLIRCSPVIVTNGGDGLLENYNLTFHVLYDGSLSLDPMNLSSPFDNTNGNSFCLEEKKKIDELDLQSTTELLVRICEAEDITAANAGFLVNEEAKMEGVLLYIYITMNLIASVLVLITIVSFLIMHQKLNIHGWTQCTHTLAYFLLLTSWLGSAIIHAEDMPPLCKALAIFDHFIYVSAYSWLVVVNFDLMKGFSHSPANVHKGRKRKCWPIYFKYSLFGWGIPGLVVLSSVGIDFTVGPHENNTIFPLPLPNYGEGAEPCSVDYIAWPYTLLPNGFLFFLVVSIIVNTIRIVLTRPQWFSTQSRSHSHKTILIWKILFGMGTFWLLDICSLFYISIAEQMHVWLHWLDFFIIFQAIPMFIIYACRPDSLQNLSEKFPRSRQLFECLGRLFCVEVQRRDTTIEMSQGGLDRLRVHRGSCSIET